MKDAHLSFSVLIAIALTVSLNSLEAEINVRDFGAIADDKLDDGAGIRAAIAESVKQGSGETIFLPRGRYLLGQDSTAPETKENAQLLLNGLKDITLRGEEGTLLVMTDPSRQGVVLKDCARVALKDIAIDYDPLPFTQGTITEIHLLRRSFDWRLAENYAPPTAEQFKHANPKGFVLAGVPPRRKKGIHAMWYESVEAIGSGVFRFHVATNFLKFLPLVAEGDKYLVTGRTTPETGNAIRIERSTDCALEHVTVYSAPMFAFFDKTSNNTHFVHCKIEPLPGSTRMISSSADGIQCKFSRHGPLIEGGRFVAVGDDIVNISTMGVQTYEAVESNRLIIAFVDYYRPGDAVRVVEQRTGKTKGEARISSVKEISWRNTRALELTLDQPIAHVVGSGTPNHPDVEARKAGRGLDFDMIANLDTMGAGFEIRGNEFRDSFVRGILLRSRNGKIENNRFERLEQAAILLGPQMIWGAVVGASNITIRGNTFVDNCLDSSISPAAEILINSDATGDVAANSDIRIENNVFEKYKSDGAIYVDYARGVSIKGNQFKGAQSVSQSTPAVTVKTSSQAIIGANAYPNGGSVSSYLRVKAK